MRLIGYLNITQLHIFLSLSLESEVIRQQRFVVLTTIAAGGHLAYCTAIFLHFSPCRSAISVGLEKKIFTGTGTAVGDPAIGDTSVHFFVIKYLTTINRLVS